MEAENRTTEQKTTLKSFFGDVLDLIEVAAGTFFVFMLLSFYVIRPVTVEGGSMIPTLRDQDKLVMLTLCPPVTNGHIVVINDQDCGYFTDDEQTQVERRPGYQGVLVKRVIATAGQEVNIDIEAGTVAVDGKQLAESYIADLTKREDGAFHYPFTVPEGYMKGCPPDVLVHEAVAFIERTIQDKMDMCVHQGECQDDHTISPDSDINPVHSGDEILFIVE